MRKRTFLTTLGLVVLGNYALQVPYYLHQYYLPRHVPPSPLGIVLLGATLAWFLVGYIGLGRGVPYGYPVLVAFLSVECLFYLQTQLAQWLSGHGILLYVLHPTDAFLFVVFGMGYLNCLVAGWGVWYLLRHRGAFTAPLAGA